MSINGIDMLFVVLGFILLLLVVEIWERYRDWFEWDRDRRRDRKHYRYEFQDSLAEDQYRVYLRRVFIFFQITCGVKSFNEAVNQATHSMEKFNEALQGETRG